MMDVKSLSGIILETYHKDVRGLLEMKLDAKRMTKAPHSAISELMGNVCFIVKLQGLSQTIELNFSCNERITKAGEIGSQEKKRRSWIGMIIGISVLAFFTLCSGTCSYCYVCKK